MDIVPLAFVTHFAKTAGEYPVTNYAANCWADEIYVDKNGQKTGIFDKCHSFINSIQQCQANGKKVLVSFGGDAQCTPGSMV